MERKSLVLLVVAMLVGAVAGALVGAIVAYATGFATAPVFLGIAGSYVGMIFSDNRFGPRSRKVRRQRAEEARRQAAVAEEQARRAALAGARAETGRAARKAAAREKR